MTLARRRRPGVYQRALQATGRAEWRTQHQLRPRLNAVAPRCVAATFPLPNTDRRANADGPFPVRAHPTQRQSAGRLMRPPIRELCVHQNVVAHRPAPECRPSRYAHRRLVPRPSRPARRRRAQSHGYRHLLIRAPCTGRPPRRGPPQSGFYVRDVQWPADSRCAREQYRRCLAWQAPRTLYR